MYMRENAEVASHYFQVGSHTHIRLHVPHRRSVRVLNAEAQAQRNVVLKRGVLPDHARSIAENIASTGWPVFCQWCKRTAGVIRTESGSFDLRHVDSTCQRPGEATFIDYIREGLVAPGIERRKIHFE